MTEIWKNIDGYEGLYQVSNLGRVRSLKFGKDRLLKPVKDKFGYLRVDLYNNHKRKLMKVHRLVAQAFLENPTNLPEVNHIDENKENNCVENLEWCSRKYNNNYGTRLERFSKSIIGKFINRKDQSKQIDQFTKDGIFIKTWCSAMEADRNGYTQQNIISCCRGRLKTHKGFIWKYHIESED